MDSIRTDEIDYYGQNQIVGCNGIAWTVPLASYALTTGSTLESR
jgi:hypothetical protein